MLGALRAACDEMGAVLVRSAHSANIKDAATPRPRCSTRRGDGHAGGAHPRAPRRDALGGRGRARRGAAAGRVWILNDPYRGGTHLPDITVITPLFHDGELAGFAASRAHHADVGAEEPGSMPGLADARRRGGRDPAPRLATDEVDELGALMRNPRQRAADLRAQLAAGAPAASGWRR